MKAARAQTRRPERAPGGRTGSLPGLDEIPYRLLFEHTVNGLVLLKALPGEPGAALRFGIVRANEAFGRIVGRPAPELVGRPLTEVLGNPPELHDACRRIAACAEPIRIEFLAPRPNRHLEATFYRPHADLCAVVFRDTTEQVRAKEALARANEELRATNRRLAQKQRELEEFVSFVSHDLKSPLIAIQGFAGLLAGRLRQHLHSGEVDYFSRVLDNIRLMETRINDLLALARVGRLATTTELVATDELVDEIFVDFSVRAAARGVRLVRTGALPAAAGSRQGIREILQNLIDNAVKYMPARAGACVQVGFAADVTAPNGARGAYYVRDNGDGIPPEHRERIFEMFHRGPRPLAGSEGSGLGLVIVRRLVESHGGLIWVDPVARAGATFYFTLPGARAAQGGRAAPEGLCMP